MKIDLLDNGCLKILLTEEDLRDYNLSFEDLDYNNENTRTALHHILDTARREIGFDLSVSLVIEAIPVDGGCLLLLTPTGGKRHVRMKRVVGPYIFELDDVDTVLHLAKSVGGNTPPMFGSSLYRFDKRYRLIIYPGAPLSREMGNLFHEFGRPAGEGDIAAAYTAEHGESIAVGDALGQLSAAMNRNQSGRIGH
ncbi:MAG: adaptor protein MecA [Oscillospiraceae bacterium]|nr:adaptor protein MecA [Oscillospiraceae bacterium]MDD4413473.1 adaptor protein MecA [Oscillospiraceae bacterium]